MEILAYIQAHWVEWLFAAITALAGLGYRSVSKQLKDRKAEQERERREMQEEQAVLKEGVMALLHDRLYQGCRYHISHGEISEGEMKNMEYLFDGYHALGGNGTGTELFERVKKLPLKEKSSGDMSRGK